MGDPAVGRSVPPLPARLNLGRRSPLDWLGVERTWSVYALSNWACPSGGARARERGAGSTGNLKWPKICLDRSGPHGRGRWEEEWQRTDRKIAWRSDHEVPRPRRRSWKSHKDCAYRRASSRRDPGARNAQGGHQPVGPGRQGLRLQRCRRRHRIERRVSIASRCVRAPNVQPRFIRANAGTSPRSMASRPHACF
jgi:hypothetical protein